MMKRRIQIGSLGSLNFPLWPAQGWTTHKLISVKLLFQFIAKNNGITKAQSNKCLAPMHMFTKNGSPRCINLSADLKEPLK